MICDQTLAAVVLDRGERFKSLAGCEASEGRNAFQTMIASNGDPLRPVPVNGWTIEGHEADSGSILAMNDGDHCQFQTSVTGEHFTVNREVRHHAYDPVRHVDQLAALTAVKSHAIPIRPAPVQLFREVPAVKASAFPSPAVLQFAFHAAIKPSRLGFVNT